MTSNAASKTSPASSPNDTVLLLDTYDTLGALEKLIAAGLRPAAVRLDSGDLASLSKEVRLRLDRAGLQQTRIVASSDLDEHSIALLVASGAPIDIFGVGTALATSKDAPALSGVYKLVEFNHRPAAKFSERGEKMSYPGAKQVWRFSQNGEYVGDEVALQDDALRDAESLLTCVMSNGRRVNPKVGLSFIRDRAAQRLKKVPASVQRIDHPSQYPVTIGDVGSLLEKCRRQVSNMQGGRNAA